DGAPASETAATAKTSWSSSIRPSPPLTHGQRRGAGTDPPPRAARLAPRAPTRAPVAGSPSEWTGRPALAERAVVTAVISGLRRAVGVFGKFVLPRGPITILVVDDDPIVLRATQDRLVRLGFRVQAELDPPSALRR